MSAQWLNTKKTYGWVAIALHWVSAVMTLTLLASGVYMVTLLYYDPLAAPLSEWHVLLGLVLAGLSVFRLCWQALATKPKINSDKLLIIWLAHAMHGLLYLALFSLFATGYFILTADGGWLNIFGVEILPGVADLAPALTVWVGQAHQWLAYGLGALIVLHTLAALKHHFLERDNTLKRILYPQK